MFYSIFDHDIIDYLHTGRNSTDKRQCLEEYIGYRFPDLEEVLIETFNITDEEADEMCCKDYLKLLSDKYILDDMCCCCFELVEHKEKLDED